jgi:hypothetical protein
MTSGCEVHEGFLSCFSALLSYPSPCSVIFLADLSMAEHRRKGNLKKGLTVMVLFMGFLECGN